MVSYGADRGRTDNLLDATEALSQLSYGPRNWVSAVAHQPLVDDGIVPTSGAVGQRRPEGPSGAPRPSGAGGAAAGEREFVVLEREALGEELLQAAGAPFHVVDAVALGAVEVVVVPGGD